MSAVLHSLLFRVGVCCGKRLKIHFRNGGMNFLSGNIGIYKLPDKIHATSFALWYTTDAAASSSDSKATETTQALLPPAVTGPSEDLLKTLSEEDQRKLKIIWMEMEVSHQSGFPVPKEMSEANWREVLERPSRSQRLKFYRFLCIRDARRKKNNEEKLARRKDLEEFRKQRDATEAFQNRDLSGYGLYKNTIFLRLYDSSLNYAYNHWQIQAIKFGQTIVVDMAYDDHMVKKECSNCAEQIIGMYSSNRMNRQPFNMYLCNANPNGTTLKYLERFLPNLHASSCLITVTPKSYLDLFPREKIVYLTPHSKKDLIEYDHDAIYVIGAIVDKSDQSPLSLAKSKKEGIRTARLPLDEYLEWGCSASKSLTLDQMMKIMLDIKNLKDWRLALKHVPPRKIRGEDDMASNPKTSFRKKRSLFNND